jgi:hypothetical protein
VLLCAALRCAALRCAAGAPPPSTLAPCAVLCRPVLSCAVPCRAVLRCAVLRCAALCCAWQQTPAVLCCAVLAPRRSPPTASSPARTAHPPCRPTCTARRTSSRSQRARRRARPPRRCRRPARTAGVCRVCVCGVVRSFANLCVRSFANLQSRRTLLMPPPPPSPFPLPPLPPTHSACPVGAALSYLRLVEPASDDTPWVQLLSNRAFSSHVSTVEGQRRIAKAHAATFGGACASPQPAASAAGGAAGGAAAAAEPHRGDPDAAIERVALSLIDNLASRCGRLRACMRGWVWVRARALDPVAIERVALSPIDHLASRCGEGGLRAALSCVASTVDRRPPSLCSGVDGLMMTLSTLLSTPTNHRTTPHGVLMQR